MTVTCNGTTQKTDIDLDENDIPDEIVKEVENFENRPKSNLDETEIISLGDAENVKETRNSVPLSLSEKEENIELLKEYEDIFAWSYDDMTGLSMSIEEVTKQVKDKVIKVVEYPTWLSNIVLVPKKDGKIWMDEEDAEKTTFITQWGIYYYKMIYNLKLNPAKCVFGVPARKLLGFIVSFRGIELDRTKVKVIQELPPPNNKKDVMSFLGGSTTSADLEHNLQLFKAVKRQALADHLVENPVDGEYEPLKTYFSDEEVSFIGEDIAEPYDSWRIFFDGSTNFKGVGIGVFLVSETGQHYSVSAKLRFPCTNNIAEYEACNLGIKMAIDMNVQELLVIGDSDLLIHQVREEWATKNSKILPHLHHVQELRKRFTKTEFQHVPRVFNEFVDALATLSSMIQHPDKNFIDPILVKIHDQPAYCAHV
ncbi:uncharacterized protein [Nicotiana sylvestris]|uniref:uncharacterized protein n=1 Tax=Nicotiana sylvestris TaxID=4096 RepID=UPI00388CA2A2